MRQYFVNMNSCNAFVGSLLVTYEVGICEKVWKELSIEHVIEQNL